MKVKKLLKNLDNWTILIIWDQVGSNDDDWEIAYKGLPTDVPFYLLDRHLLKTNPDDENGAIAAYKTDDGNYGIRITLANE